MPSELEEFKKDLLESARQMRRGRAVRVTKVELPPAAQARAASGMSQQEFAELLGVSARPSDPAHIRLHDLRYPLKGKP